MPLENVRHPHFCPSFAMGCTGGAHLRATTGLQNAASIQYTSLWLQQPLGVHICLKMMAEAGGCAIGIHMPHSGFGNGMCECKTNRNLI